MGTAAKAGFSMMVWWAVFIAATVSFSLFLNSFKAFTLMPSLPDGLAFFGSSLLLIASFGALVYDSYMKERVKGRVQRRVPLFDKLLQMQYPKLNDTDSQLGDNHAAIR